MRSLVRLVAVLAAGAALASCDEHDKGTSESASGDPVTEQFIESLPPQETAFKRAVIARYLADQSAYDKMPNNIAKEDFETNSAQNLCGVVQNYAVVQNWKGVLVALDRDGNKAAFKFDLGNGFMFISYSGFGIDGASDAYKAAVRMRIGDVATISGRIVNGTVDNLCSLLPKWSLHDRHKDDSNFYFLLDRLNGASAAPPPPAPAVSSSEAESGAEESAPADSTSAN